MLGRISLFLIAVYGFVLTAEPARAKWHEASSENFVIYSDQNPKQLTRFAQILERFHQAMELQTRRDLEPPSPSNRVTVYAVSNEAKLKKLWGDRNSFVLGFYIPRAGGSVAFVPRPKGSAKQLDPSLSTLLHEYAHHFLISSSRHAMTRWYSEGAAEYFSSARFHKDGTVEVGRPNNQRWGELRYAESVAIRELLDHELYRENRGRKYDSFYGRSWLLFHYLVFNEDRRGQITKYLQGMSGGASSLDAAQAAFGDLDQLEKELDAYQNRRTMMAWAYPPDATKEMPVTVRRLSDGMDEMMDVIVKSRRGVTREEAQELLPDARKIAAKFPDDAEVLAALAEAEFDAGNDAEAIAAADRAVAIDPTVKKAYVQKGYALFRQAEDADRDGKDAAYRAAMKPFEKLNALENDHPLPLIYYYRSYAQRGKEPPENAKHALERASQLAPFDHSLALNVAMMQAGEGKIQLARFSLAPIAANPHGGGMAEYAQQVIDDMKDATDGKPYFPNFIPMERVEVPPIDADED